MIHDVCNTVGLLYGTCQQIFSDKLNMWRNAAKFVPRPLSNDQKEYTTLLSALSSKNRMKTTPISSPISLLVMNIGCLDMTWNDAAIVSVEDSNFTVTKRKHEKFGAISIQFWFVFWTLKALCIRNLFHQERQWMENSIAMLWGNWGKHSAPIYRQVAQQLLGPASWQCTSSCVISCAAVIGLLRRWQSSTTLPTHQTLPLAFFFLFLKMKLKLKGWHFDSSERSRPNHMTWWRRWHKMTSSSASNHGNPTGITVSMQKRTILKGTEANITLGKWLNYGRGIVGVCLWHWHHCLYVDYTKMMNCSKCPPTKCCLTKVFKLCWLSGSSTLFLISLPAPV